MTVPKYLICECRRCGHAWFKRVAEPPKYCPKCKQRNWDVPAGKLKRGRPKKAAGKGGKR